MIAPGALPELLCPAGSPEALRAALQGGADAVYFGGPTFNARMRAENFTAESMKESISLCHAFGVRAYVTLNTLCRDVEIDDFLRAAELAWRSGADALIVADLGGATSLRRVFPEFELHASTQMSGHSLDAARQLRALGFTRMVLARETPAKDMRRFVAESGMETEVFVHGALCVSHSGQCLFSSLVGGRSGNRGECAQPCRLPDGRGQYPLSLKDLTLAAHVPELIDMGVDSLKIEGRLKAPEYVRDVAVIWRRLLDERRAADKKELAELAASFSRGGFTDGYFTERISHDMLGVRSEADKQQSRNTPPFVELSRRVPLDIHCRITAGVPMELTIKTDAKTAHVTGDIPLIAENRPTDADAVAEKLCRLGGTPYTPRRVEIEIAPGLMVPASRLNDLRRRAVAALEPSPRAEIALPKKYALPQPQGARSARPTARFVSATRIPQGATDYFEHIYLPIDAFEPPADGVILPPVIFDHERAEISALLQKARERGAKHALVGNLGHLALATEAGLVPHGDFRLNITNRATLDTCLSLGFADALLSPELTLPQIRDVGGASDVIIYGRIPLMLLEKCIGRELGSCEACTAGRLQYTDRRGEKFPVVRVFGHRNELCNCHPTGMSDRRAALLGAGITGGHFVFTVESAAEAAEVLYAYQNGLPLTGKCRRI